MIISEFSTEIVFRNESIVFNRDPHPQIYDEILIEAREEWDSEYDKFID